MADQLLKLMLAERALLPVDVELDQPVEFVQFSANTRTLLGPADDSLPASQQLDSVTKLRGVELHHFAAFYKSSWRAWDWMWGRLDGCGWLVHILLDPARILAVVENQPAEYPEQHRAERFAQKLRDAIGLPGNLPGDCLDADLAFLDNHDADIPVSLPNSALFIARAWQNLIAANELPAVAERMVADGGRLPGKQAMSTPPDAWVTRVFNLRNSNASAAEFARELQRCPVRQETLAGELRTPAFARLAAKAAAVVTAAVATAPEAPGAVRPVLSSARTVTRTGYLATKVTNGSGWITLLAGVLLAVIGVVLATQGMLAVGLSGTIVALVGAYLIALGAWGIHRGALTAIAAITALAVPVLLTVHWVRIELWGNGKDINNGWVPRDVLPWLRDNWWAGLAVLGGVIVLAILISLIPRRRPPRNRAPTKASGPPASSASVSTDSALSGGKPANAVAQAPGAAEPARRRQKRNPCLLVRRQRSRSGTLGPDLPGQRALRRARVQFRGPPAVPGRHRPVGPERLAERLELARGRLGDLPGQPVAAADAEVADRPDVQPPQLEDQEHLRRPRPDAAHRRQPRDDLVVALPGQPARRQHHRRRPAPWPPGPAATPSCSATARPRASARRSARAAARAARRLPPSAAISRPWMAAAARPASCW